MNKISYSDKLGYFDDESMEYVIKDMYPKRTLKNFLWSDEVVCNADQFGFGDSFALADGYRRRLDDYERLIFIKDDNTKELYSPNRNYNKLPFSVFECHVGLGYQKIISEYKGLNVEFTIAVPLKGKAIQYNVKISNKSDKERNFTLYFIIRPGVVISGDTSNSCGDKDEKFGGLYFPHFSFESSTDYGALYFSSEKKYNSYCVTGEDIYGAYGSFFNPEGLKNNLLSNKGSCFDNTYYVCVSIPVKLNVNECENFSFALATGKSLDESADIATKFANTKEFHKTISEQIAVNNKSMNVLKADIPDKFMQSLVNIWLKRQLSLGKTWGRVYGKGFRDVMQDISAFVSLDVPDARRKILNSLSHQYKSGNPIRMFEPDYTAEYNDGATWIPATVSAYLKESNDFTILDEKVLYLDGGDGTVFDHVYRGVSYLISDVGKHGLVLFRRGDWNDSTNGAGNLGVGESVWTTLATVKCLKEFAEICGRTGKADLQKYLIEKSEDFSRKIMKYGFINGHFIHGYDDWGNIIGGEKGQDGEFCLNMQTWAVLSETGDLKIRKDVMDQVEEKLKCSFGYALSAPAYKKPVKGVGRTSYFMPGLCENASVYVHGNMFKAAADCKLKRADSAYNTLCNVMYKNNKNSGVEPYAITNMFIGPESKYRVGEAPMSWITGSAGWMYRIITEEILGVKAEFDGLKVDPLMPSNWNNIYVERIFRDARYKINYVRKGKFALYMDGEKVNGNMLPIVEKGKESNIIVEF